MTGPHFFLELGTLFASQPSGIPALTRALARHLAEDIPDNSVFMHNGRVLDPAVVRDLLAQEQGGELPYLAVLGDIYTGTVAEERARQTGPAAGIFPLARPQEMQFDHVTQLVCDLTPVMFPDWHTAETRATFATLLAALPGSDLIIAISASAQADLLKHAGPDPAKVLVARPDLPPAPQFDPAAVLAGDSVAPFLLMLGTIEPRKNLQLVLRFLAAQPEVLARYQLVVAGRDGWGPTLKEQVALHHLPADRIVQLGFVSTREKQALLATASMLLFPSRYEGFGLPVLEALAAGCPVLAARVGGIPEAGGDAVAYHDPDNIADFTRAFFALEEQLAGDRAGLVARGRNRATTFAPGTFARAVTNRIAADLAGRGQ